jgi:hypothetical protein
MTGLHGRPDRIEQAGRHLRVVDFKTGSGQTDLRPSQRRQLLLYAYLVHRQLGRWPNEIAVEDAAGRRIVEPVQPAEVDAVVQEAVAAVHEFNDSLLRGPSMANIASPAADACRQCAFRAACGPFWQELDPDWQLLACLAGLMQEEQKYPRRLVLRVEAPKWMAGRRVSVLGYSGVAEEAQIVAVVDASPAGTDQVRIRWYTQLVPWRDSTTSSPSRIS